jgi:hypothetical protein
MAYATLDRHAQELVDYLTPSTEEQLSSLEAATELMRRRHQDQLRRFRELWRLASDELEVQRAANRGLLEALRECRATQRRKR